MSKTRERGLQRNQEQWRSYCECWWKTDGKGKQSLQKKDEEENEKREACEREITQQMETMWRQMEPLMDLVKESKKGGTEVMSGSRISSHTLKVKLVALSDKDDIEAYLMMFKHIMEAYTIPKSEWTYHLAPQLIGWVQQAFAALLGDNASVYKELKAAILLRYNINEESYQCHFREKVRESNRAMIFTCWIWSLSGCGIVTL